MFQRSYLSNSPYKLVFNDADDELNELNKDDDKFNRCDDSDNEIYNLTNSIDDLIKIQNDSKFDSLQRYNRRKRRQLPKTPDKKPFQKLIGCIDDSNRKIIRQISNTLSLEIELINNYPKSIKLINKDNELDNNVDKLDQLSNSIDYRSLDEQLNLANEINSINKLNQNKIEANYRGLHRFIAHHDDEISIDIGDEIFVIKKMDDYWYKGINLATNLTGIFPSLYVIDSNYDELFQTKTVNYFGTSDDDSGLNCDDLDSNGVNDSWLDIGKQRYQIQKERFCLEFLGSLEVRKSNGKEVLDECFKRIIKASNSKDKNQLSFTCLIEICNLGIRFFNQEQPEQNVDDNNNLIETKLNQIKYKDDYFFNLKNITYCDYLDLKTNDDQLNCDYNYFAFISKHPTIKNKYASHCFLSKNANVSKYICESIANAFHRYYQNFIELSQNFKD